MTTELPPSYEPKLVDPKWLKFWMEKNLFKADPQSKKPPFCIVIPPPNVTGSLHMGHALVDTLQDILIRWKRMSGFETLWVPGTDHAGIATQTVVERHLMKTLGKRRKDFSREEFLSHVWKWKDENENRIVGQLKQMGCSCDWSLQRFTMDEGNNSAVRTIFKKLYDAGLIYRGDYLVNWDPVTQTALADDEVEHEERQSFLWHFKYPYADGSGFAVIATTRPETMLGDTAIAVAPKDIRYMHLIGKMVKLPLTGREIPIIADHHVDPEFGSGMVKVTPAHDPNDYQMGLTHKLPLINIMTPDGRVNENGGKYAGMTFEEAREAVIAAMKELQLIEKIEPHANRVGVSYRSKAIIQPYMSEQWFVKMDKFGEHLKKAIKEGKTRLVPKNWESVYFHWIDNLRDWCISRQLWWGHRIPIWYHKDDPKRMICYAGEGEPEEVRQNPHDWKQDEDVLDTWFSSALWPFAALGWPENTAELKKFYPNSVLVTGHDILFFWVARMIMMGEYVMGEVPFPDTFLHGLIYGKSYWRVNPEGGITYLPDHERLEYDLGKQVPKDVFSKWEKMSKSKGNIIDPLEIIDQYGTDAMRMALCASATQAREIDLDRRRFEEFKNFTNKIWNGARFVLMNLQGDNPLTSQELLKGLEEPLLKLEDKWILSSLNKTVKDVNDKLANYAFDQAALLAYDFFWKEFCSYYVEIAKPILFGKTGTPAMRQNKQKILCIVLLQTIRLLHPMAPFITEELFHILKEKFKEAWDQEVPHGIDPYTKDCLSSLQATGCIVSSYPQVISEKEINPVINETFDLVGSVIYTIRNIRGEMKLPPGSATDVHIVGNASDPHLTILKENQGIISALVKINHLTIGTTEPLSTFSATGMVHALKVIIPLPKEREKEEKERLNKELERVLKSLEKIKSQLDNQEFVLRAPKALIDKQKAMMEQLERELSEIQEKLTLFCI